MFNQQLVVLKSALTVELFCALRAFDMIWIARPAGPLAALLFQPHTKIQMLASKSETPFRYIKSSCAKITPNTHSTSKFQQSLNEVPKKFMSQQRRFNTPQQRSFNNEDSTRLNNEDSTRLNNEDSTRYPTKTKIQHAILQQRRFNTQQQQSFTRYNNEQF